MTAIPANIDKQKTCQVTWMDSGAKYGKDKGTCHRLESTKNAHWRLDIINKGSNQAQEVRTTKPSSQLHPWEMLKKKNFLAFYFNFFSQIHDNLAERFPLIKWAEDVFRLLAINFLKLNSVWNNSSLHWKAPCIWALTFPWQKAKEGENKHHKTVKMNSRVSSQSIFPIDLTSNT